MSYNSNINTSENWKAQNTSADAAKDMHESGAAATLRKMVMDAFAKHGAMTSDEVANVLGKDILSIRPRLSELVKAGYLHNTFSKRKNNRGRNAVVWDIWKD